MCTSGASQCVDFGQLTIRPQIILRTNSNWFHICHLETHVDMLTFLQTYISRKNQTCQGKKHALNDWASNWFISLFIYCRPFNGTVEELANNTFCWQQFDCFIKLPAAAATFFRYFAHLSTWQRQCRFNLLLLLSYLTGEVVLCGYRPVHLQFNWTLQIIFENLAEFLVKFGCSYPGLFMHTYLCLYIYVCMYIFRL